MTIIIVGDGKVGLALTQILTREGQHNVTVIDSNLKVLERMQEECDAMAVQGHGASRAVLKEAGAEEADLLIAATSADEINLLSCLIAKKLGCKNTIARVRNPEYADDIGILRKDMGLSFAINPDESCAREIAHLLQFPSFLGRERFAKGRVEIVQIKAKQGSPLVNTKLSNLYKISLVKVLVCAIERNGDVIVPHGNFTIQEGDDLFITASTSDLAALIKNLGLYSQKVTQVTIVGGSRLALYLSYRLIHAGVGVKIIEKRSEQCRFLADLLPEADIVEADGTDQDILLAEGVERSDALVTLTAMDEENLVLSMYAKKLGIPRVITKCNRSQYQNMFRVMGIDTVISPKTTCATEIARYVQAMDNSSGHHNMLSLHPIAGGKAEAMEFEADNHSKLLGIPLATLPLKNGILIAGINRGKETIIPSGDTLIQNGDTVVVVTAGEHILELDQVLAE